MTGMQVDVSELRRLGTQLKLVAPALVPKIKPIVTKGAQNIKKAMQADAKKSKHFKQLAAAVGYDINRIDYGLDGGFEAVIGYGGKGEFSYGAAAAPLAGIAIFGSSRPGGGTVRNPEEALKDEAPNFEAELGKLADGILP